MILEYVIILSSLTSVMCQNCNFDDGSFCNWIQSKQDDGDWDIQSTAISAITGPRTGHTLFSFNSAGNISFTKNHYIYLNVDNFKNEFNDVIPDKSIVLLSPPLERSSVQKCFRFFYHMYGETVNSLSVGVVNVNDDSIMNLTTKTEIFAKKGNQGEIWLCQKFLFTASDSTRIYMEAKTGTQYTCVIALDDLEILPTEQCSQAVPCATTKIERITSTTTTTTTISPLNNTTNNTDEITSKNTPLSRSANGLATSPSTPKEDNTELLLYSVAIPVAILLVVSIIAIICYIKRPKEEMEFVNYPDIPDRAVRENPGYQTANGVYSEIEDEEIYHEVDDVDSTYLEPSCPNNISQHPGTFESMNNDRDVNNEYRGNKPSPGPQLPPRFDEPPPRPCEAPSSSRYLTVQGSSQTPEITPSRRYTENDHMRQPSGFDSPYKGYKM